ncbi:MAG: PaaI family thioesterase [Nocardioides sp.]|uniref:PaaI family thioesterase n=1 Tax=Nocardioides sp. TaxID=35761 RepID=UPI0032631258
MTLQDLGTDAPASWGEPRSRTVTWYDPAIGAGEGLAMAGLDYLQAMIDGILPPPPISGLIDMALVAAEAGRVEFTCEPDESAYNPIGSVHGGLVCTLLDSVAGCALHSTLSQGRGYTSVEIKINYLKPVRSTSGQLTAVGTVVKAGSRVAFTEGVVTDASGAVVATATSTLLVFDLPT